MWVEETPETSDAYYRTSSIVDNGNLIVTGNVLNDSGDTDIITVKYDSNGDTLWSKTYNGSANDDDYGIDLAVQSNGEVVVIGAAKTTAGDYDFIVLCYNDSTGSTIWTKVWDGDGNGKDIPSALDIDSGDQVYVAGGF